MSSPRSRDSGSNLKFSDLDPVMAQLLGIYETQLAPEEHVPKKSAQKAAKLPSKIRRKNRVSFAPEATQFIYDSEESIVDNQSDPELERTVDNFQAPPTPPESPSFANSTNTGLEVECDQVEEIDTYIFANDVEQPPELPLTRGVSVERKEHQFTTFHQVKFESDFHQEKVLPPSLTPLALQPSTLSSLDIPMDMKSEKTINILSSGAVLESMVDEVDLTQMSPTHDIPFVPSRLSSIIDSSSIKQLEENLTIDMPPEPPEDPIVPDPTSLSSDTDSYADECAPSVPDSPPFYTTAAMARIARKHSHNHKKSTKIVLHNPAPVNRPVSWASSIITQEFDSDSTFQRFEQSLTPFPSTARKPFVPPPKTKKSVWLTRRKICCISLFMFLGVFAVGAGAVIALIRVGVIDPASIFPGLIPSTRRVDPNDPNMQLIIPSNTPTGRNGCSNVPMRAARMSSQLDDKGRANTADKCSNSAFRYTLTECDVQEYLQPSTVPANYLENYVRKYLPHLLDALEAYDLNCARNRLAVFLAQVRHETAGLLTMKQVIDGGSGAVHLLPAYFSRAVERISVARKVYEETEKGTFADKYPLSDLARLGSAYRTGGLTPDERKFVDQVGDMISRPEITFRVAGWWFEEGSAEIMSDVGCGDLRLAADVGLGAVSTTGSTMDGTTGYYEVTKCIYGTAVDPGLQQRISLFTETLNATQTAWKCQTKECRVER